MSKIKYHNQLRNFSCGCTAIINAAIWAGARMNHRKECKILCELLGVDKEGGTYPDMMKDAINFSSLPYKISKTRNNPTITMIRKHVNKGGAVMLFYAGHVSLVTEVSKTHLSLINHNRYVILTKLTDKKLREWLKHEPKAFFLVKHV